PQSSLRNTPLWARLVARNDDFPLNPPGALQHGRPQVAPPVFPFPSVEIMPPAGGGGTGTGTSADGDRVALKPMCVPASALLLVADHCPNLKSLSLAGTHVVPDTRIAETGEFLSQLARAPQPYLSREPVVPAAALLHVAECCTLLVALDLAGSDWVTDAVAREVVKQCRRLCAFNLLRCARLAPAAAAKLYLVQHPSEMEPLVLAHLRGQATA
ncbi:hypothetical protein HK405_012482, partial [Cladochytrium tenue]